MDASYAEHLALSVRAESARVCQLRLFTPRAEAYSPARQVRTWSAQVCSAAHYRVQFASIPNSRGEDRAGTEGGIR
jgi:hypothetical protein